MSGAPAAGASAAPRAFPLSGVLPKEETGAAALIAQSPASDGRGAIIAVFDTGVDPGAAGLETTPDGRPKMIGCVDCTGDGDVVCSTVRTVKPGERALQGLSGRELRLGPEAEPAWRCPTGECRVGAKRLYELLPGELVKRVKEDRRRRFDEQHRGAVAEARRALGAFDAAHPDAAALATAERRARRDLDLVVTELVEAAAEKYDDAGPVLDCVVWHDGARWRAAVDESSDGRLDRCPPLPGFADAGAGERRWSTLDAVAGSGERAALMNYCVNIYEDGALLSVVCDSDSHGTHVAGIAAAHYPDSPELNGVAPGAQVLSCKIGDTRLDAMETGTSIVRALIEAKRRGADVINMSFGESYTVAEAGRVHDVITEYVDRHGLTFVCAAMNSGPALSSVGSPAGTCPAIISVGAYVSQSMMEAEYSLREALPATNYTWSSRGPAADGALGVSVVAPGGAIAPIPQWCLSRKQLMNGTSMASPNCAGGLALLVSALKARGVRYTPHSLQRALENTARQVPGLAPLAAGHGLIDLPAALDWAEANASSEPQMLRYEISIPSRQGARGLYLREASEVDAPKAVLVRVTPRFADAGGSGSARERVAFEAHVALRSSCPDWLTCPQFLVLHNDGRGFEIHVDPTRLPPGVYCAEVTGTDTASPDSGPLFRVPVTVLRPEDVPAPAHRLTLSQQLRPGGIERRFFVPPTGARWATFSLRCHELGDGERHLVVLHCSQVAPQTPCTGKKAPVLDEYVWLKPHTEVEYTLKLEAGRTLEVTLAKYWSSIGGCSVGLDVCFDSVESSADTCAVTCAAPGRVTVAAPLRPTKLDCSAKLTHIRRVLKPKKKGEVRALPSDRDLLSGERQICSLVLEYAFKVEAKEAKCLPRPQWLWPMLYDSPLESQLWTVRDCNKQVMRFGDALHVYDVTLSKGEYTVELALRHDDSALLDKLRGMPITVDLALEKDVTCPVHGRLQDARPGGAKLKEETVPKGAARVVYVAPPAAKDQSPDGAECGDELVGELSLHKHRSLPLRFLVPPKDPKEDDEKKDDDDEDDEALLRDAVRDAKVGRAAKLRGAKKWRAARALADALAAEYPGDIKVLAEVMELGAAVAGLEKGDDGEDDGADGRAARRLAACRAAEAVVAAARATELAAHYGVILVDDGPVPPAVARERKRFDERRDALRDALSLIAEQRHLLLAPAPSRDPAPGAPPSAWDDFERDVAELRRWVDPAAEATKRPRAVALARLIASQERRAGRPGAALHALRTEMTREGHPAARELTADLRALCRECGWAHLDRYWADREAKLFPSAGASKL